MYTSPHTTKPEPTHVHTFKKNSHTHIHAYQNPHITKPTRTHIHTLQNPHIHTPTHLKPIHKHIHTLQNPIRTQMVVSKARVVDLDCGIFITSPF
jgi:hypothetical protein